jgi:hypothetical protein
MICARRPQRESAGTADGEEPFGADPVMTVRKDCAMPGVKVCGEMNPEAPDEACRRRNGHAGRHRGRRGTTWTNKTPRPQLQRFVPPHRRKGSETYEYTGRRYRRPESGAPTFAAAPSLKED